MKTSFIIISYNQEKYIIDTLNGVLNQTLQPDEVIIADDGSVDRTQNLITEFINRNNLNDTWKTIFSDTNNGITHNLKNAFDHATGDILILNAGDDISLPNRCQHAIDTFNLYPNLYIITGSLTRIDSEGTCIDEINYDDKIENDVYSTIKNGMPTVFPVGQSIRRTIFDKFGPLPTTVPNEDDQLSFWGILSGGIFCSREKIMLYRIHSDSASSWLRKNQTGKAFVTRFISDMPVRKKHMQLWLNVLPKERSDYEVLAKTLNKKIEMFDFFENISTVSFMKRLKFLMTHHKAMTLREKYYSILGTWGVISWQKLRLIAGRK